MQDDQWPYSPSRGGQRERANDSPAGSSSQRPGRPPNGASPSSNGRTSGPINYSSGSQPRMPTAGNQRPAAPRPGPSGPLSRSQARDDGWGPSSTSTYQPRRPSGPMNPSAPAGGGRSAGDSYTAGRRPSGPTAAGGARPPGRGGGWEDEDQRWPGSETARPSRGGSSALDAPGAGRQSGRVATGQRGSGGIQRGWASQDDPEEEDWTPGGRAPAAGQRRGSGGTASGRSGKSGTAARTVRDGWVIETPTRTPPNPLRTRLLLTLLLVIVILGGAVVAVPSVRQKVLAHIPGLGGSSSSGQTSGNTGTLSIQVNVPTAKVTVDNQTVTVQPGQNGGFATATMNGLSVGSHALTIHADNFADLTSNVSIKAGTNSFVAWLAPSADALTAAIKQFGPAAQPDPGVAGDHYLAAGNKVTAAAGAITVSISYTISGLDPKTFTSQLPPGSDTTTSPFQPATVTLAPVVTFKDGNGNTLATYSPAALPATQFALQMVPGTDDKGAVQLSATGITIKTSGGKDVTTDFSGPAKNDYALYYAIAAVLPASPANALTFKCIGAVDNKNYNPEDGLQIFETTNGAHYFYRWGILWATNGPAKTLTPTAPQAQGGSNEFNDANAANANGSCGS